MQTTLKILSALLGYPDAAVRAAAPGLAGLLAADGVLSPAQCALLQPLLDRLANDDLLDVEEAYVALFDRGRAVSLHLFEHVHGESRDRGQAMVDLRARYEREGLEIAASELPDYLPLFLEYLSLLPAERSRAELAEPGLILAALATRLGERGTPWAAPLAVLAALAGYEGDGVAASDAAREDPDDLAALDAAWAEAEVRFDAPAPPGAACPLAAAMVARFQSTEPGRSTAHG